MKNRAILLSLSMAWLLCVTISDHAWGEPIRVAVAGDPSLANLVDITTSELSKQPDLNVLDRADLDRLGQEQEIQSVLNSKDFSPVRLLPADGLVLLHSAINNGKTGIFARLVAVQPGVILREIPLSENSDPVTLAQTILKEFAPYWSKLAAIQRGKIAALSLLGLRFEVDRPETRNLERQVNILLASRLSAEPDTLVLERWRLNDALFEKTLSPQQSSPFWTGSSLIDGSMRWKDGHIEATLRVRPPQGPEITVTDQDTVENLPALIDRMAVKIHNQPSTQSPWKLEIEADHFALLGKWCLDNRLFDEGAEAIESALALGDHSRTTHMLQVKAYAMEAYPDDLHVLNASSDNYHIVRLSPDSLSQRLVAATRAAQLAQEYLKANRDFSSVSWNLEDPTDLSVPVLDSCLRILWASYDNGLEASHPNEMAELRHELQKLIPAMDDRLLPQPPSLQRGAFLNYRAFYAGLWHETPEETIQFYREILKGGKIDGSWVREELFRTHSLREPHLDDDSEPSTFTWPSMGPPWIVSWDGRSVDEIKTIWQNFIKELAASPDPISQCDALKFEMGSDRTVTGRNAVLARFTTFLSQHLDIISGPQGKEFVTGCGTFFEWARERRENAALKSSLSDLCLTLFKQHAVLPATWIYQTSDLLYLQEPVEAVKSFLAVLDDYTRWYNSQPQQDGEVLLALARVHQSIYHAYPALAPAAPAEDFLSVNHFYKAEQENAVPTQGAPKLIMVDPRTFLTTENKVWFLTLTASNMVICADPVTLQTVSSYPIPKELLHPPHPVIYAHHRFLEVTPQWIVVGMAGQVLLCSRSDGQWRALDVPPSCYKPRWVNQQLYLLYDAEFGDTLNSINANNTTVAGSGLIRVSLPDGACEDLISSRRIPPQTALDGKPLGTPLDLWMSASTLNLAFYNQTIYTSPIEKNVWSPLATAPIPRGLKVTPVGALIHEGNTGLHFGQIALLSDGVGKLLLSDTGDGWTFYKDKPAWNCPPDVHTVLSPIMRDSDLCFYYKVISTEADGKQASLYYFSAGQKEGIRIPLAFDFQQMKDPKLTRFQVPSLNFENLQATDYGLILAEDMHRGFWVIPWSDIDAYRAKVNSVPVK